MPVDLPNDVALADPAAAGSGGGPAGSSEARSARRALVVVVVAAAALFAFLAYLYSGEHWFPATDDALTEMRVRAVWSLHPPLIGLPGRIGIAPNYGSHPGPLSFYALWPGYRLFGESSWALQVSTMLLHLGAIVCASVLVYRRNRAGLVLGFGAALFMLVAFFGPLIMSEPWNPYLPVLWWVAFMVAVWALMCGDWLAAPIAVAAGSFCVATHISYAGLVSTLLLVGALTLFARVRWGVLSLTRAMRVSLAVSFALGVALWVPPVVDQLQRSPGNLGIIVGYFANPPQSPIGWSQGTSLLLSHLDVWNLLQQRLSPTGPELPGLLFLLVWIASVAVAARRRLTELLLLDVVIAAALVAGTFSMARIFGLVHFYLMLWSYGILALMLVAVAWTIVEWLKAHKQLRRPVVAVLATLVLIPLVSSGVAFARDAESRPLPGDVEQRTLATLAPATKRALDRRAARVAGRQLRYTMDWRDPVRLGDLGFALLEDLQRNGYAVGASPAYRQFVPLRNQRSVTQADAVLHVAIGIDIGTWRSRPGAVAIASADPRSVAQRVAFAEQRRKGLRALRAANRMDLAARFLNASYISQFDPQMPPTTREAAAAMTRLGARAVVFLVPLHA